MRISNQLLRSKATGPLQTVEYLDLNGLGLVSIEKLSVCSRLQTLILRGNKLADVSNLECCQQLWKLDLSNNEIRSLDCLAKFVAMGTLNLANNCLSWPELGKLRHLHILELNLHGNQALEKDPYYRIHVIDCLPNVWMLDGRIITSAERLQVKHFFQDSALTDHPIRHKLSKEWFVPSALKKIEVNGIYGQKSTHLMTRFPANGPQNIESDRKRLKYLAFNTQEDLMIEKKFTKRDFQVLKYRRTFLEDLLDIRPHDRERCNMLLLLLVASLEFIMPTHLVKETLETAKLGKLGKVYTMDLFLLPKDIRCHIVCILLSAVKVDKDSKEDGGLYDRLYLCLFYTVAELTKLSHSVNGRNVASKGKLATVYRDYKCLLASEVVQLLCIVPAFFEYVDKDVGVMNLVVTATGDMTITDKIGKLTEVVNEAGGDQQKLYEELSEFLLQKVQEQSMNLSNRTHMIPKEEEVYTNLKAYPMKPHKSPIDVAEYHAKGITSPNLDPPQVLSPRRLADKNRRQFPHLGDFLLLGPQTFGKIISLPQPFLALVAMDSIPVQTGAMESKLKQSEDHYTYVNMDQLAWDPDLAFWKPKGAIGDRFTIHTIEDLRKELNRRSNMSGDQLPRPNSPEEYSRPFSTLSGRPESTTPLIYSPHGLLNFGDHAVPRMKNHDTLPPRPMSSLLKEKLDLKLDFSQRSQSAAALDIRSISPRSTQTIGSPRSPRNTPASLMMKPPDSSKTDPEHDATPECVHCALEAAIARGKSEETLGQDGKPGKTESDEHNHQDHSSQQHSTQDHKSKPPDNKDQEDNLGGSDEEPELQNLNSERDNVQTSRSNVDTSQGQTDNSKSSEKTAAPVPRPASTPTLQVSIPQVEIVDPNEVEEEKSKSPKKKGKSPYGKMSQDENQVPFIRGRQSQISNRSRPSSRASTVLSGQTRPFSAMDAYRYIVSHPRKPIGSNESTLVSTYQQQRTEAWRQSAQTSRTTTPVQPRQGTPPPQRPTSPDANKTTPRPASALRVQKGNDWLAGGRDLYWESMMKRPRSGHVPGWKEGLPESMKRPRSAMTSGGFRGRPKTAGPVTPSSLAYEAAMVQGRWSARTSYPQALHDPDLPEPLELSQYQPLYQHLGLPRRLGSPLTGTAENYTQPAQDTVYSNAPPSSPTRMWSPGAQLSQLCMQCIYEDLMEETSTTDAATATVATTTVATAGGTQATTTK